MKELIKSAEIAQSILKEKGAHDSFVTLTQVESQEFNIESNKVNLLRTVFDQNVSMKCFFDHKVGSCSNNQFSEASLKNLSEKTILMAKESPADEGNVMPEGSGIQHFDNLVGDCDQKWMNQWLIDFLEEKKKNFPKTIIESTVLKHNKVKKVHLSSKGSFFTSKQSYYSGFVMFTTKDGKKSSSFNYVGFEKNKSKTPLMQTSGLHELLQQSSEQVVLNKIPSKFTGEILVTPNCMESIAGAILGYIGNNSLLKKESFLQNKLGEKVASPLWSLTSNPVSKKFVYQYYWNEEGFLSENEVLFDKGVLESYVLSDYAARKLKEKRSLSNGIHLSMNSGESNYADMVKSIKKGILLCRFSGGRPADNGDFSGVAKNSYYIENGKIQYPVSEVMVSGNFSEMLKNVVAVSNETINFGNQEFPWVQFSDLVVS